MRSIGEPLGTIFIGQCLLLAEFVQVPGIGVVGVRSWLSRRFSITWGKRSMREYLG